MLARIDANLQAGKEWMEKADLRFTNIDNTLADLKTDKAVREDRAKRNGRVLVAGSGIFGAGLTALIDHFFKG